MRGIKKEFHLKRQVQDLTAIEIMVGYYPKEGKLPGI